MTAFAVEHDNAVDTKPLPCGESCVHDGEIFAMGVPIGELIDNVSYVDMLFFQLQRRYPSDVERQVIDAYLVSLCEHGVTSPSTHGARVAASVRAPFAACAINFISAAMGPYHFGALECAMREIQHIADDIDDMEIYIDQVFERGDRVWGYGHRFHRSPNTTGLDENAARELQEHTDPRVRKLVELADQLGWDGKYLRTARNVGRALYARKRIPINIDGIAAGLLLDMGFDARAAMLFVMIGRLPNMARLYLEEQEETPNRFVALATNRDRDFRLTVDRTISGQRA
ncbi:MAG: citryl-CoA lyase [Phycisphaeraceae bacterium]|nr:citryl-CoA lyase [Phycisphaerales bacterium]MCB9861061.1 citryl-CoA lyase [Phycisphaeraceae bacterium]